LIIGFIIHRQSIVVYIFSKAATGTASVILFYFDRNFRCESRQIACAVTVEVSQ